MASSAAKANGDNPSAVKKVISSGTFGAGSVRSAPAVKTATSGGAKPTTAAPGVRKTTTAASGTTSRTASGTKPATTAAPTRRASLAPATRPAASTVTRNPLSSSVNTKTATADPAKARASVASPTGSQTSGRGSTTPAARPRASISEAVRKPTAPARPTATTARTASGTRTTALSRTAATKTATASIGSIKELKEDTKALEELRGQLKDAEDLLKVKEEAVTDLEEELEKLKASLQSALDDVESKSALTDELTKAKAELESQLEQLQQLKDTTAAGNEEEHGRPLKELQDELESAKQAGSEQASEVERLRAQVTELEAAVSAAKAELEAAQTKAAAALSDASQASSVENEALLKAQEDFKAISNEIETLKAAHSEALEKANSNVAELEAKAAQAGTLQEQLEAFKAEREETAGKVSELEVEVLELKEQIEELEEERNELKSTIKSLEEQLANGATALQNSTKAAQDKEAEHTAQIEALNAKRDQDIKDAEERYSALQETLQSIQNQLTAALAAQEKAEQDIIAAQNAHDEQVKQLTLAHEARIAELNAQIASISETLQNQEAIYDTKVQVVKDEHQTLLKEAFERAKSEAATNHAQELQALRAESKATIEEIQQSNKVALDSIKNDHASSLESTVNDYTKKINNLNLELKATKDDLSKSKSALESLRAELETATQQRDEARSAASATPTVPSEHLEEVARLTQQLAITKDDLAAVTDQLNLTKSSMQEMSEKHQKDLEEAAQNRAAEIIRINGAHDAEVTSLATQKSELLIKLSDLEGELATVKADLAAAQTASPKTNGASQQAPASPGVTKEELAKLHEAHNLKVYDLQAEHEKAIKALKQQLEDALEKTEQLNADVARKAMEIQYLEQEQDENQEQIRQLTEDLEAARNASGAPVAAA
ncbi:hypothetical protein CC2G_000780 [Coprinopsis cinerea AmutBmut pab1-1]|nr:hypothetical protein CC2G_000780 [Coprinopsis cinerea AmutBmut pab1-1]